MSVFRIGGVIALTLLGTACTEREVVDVVTPLAESGDLLDGQMPRSLRFRNGALVRFGHAILLGDWVCGKPPGQGMVCVEGRRVMAVEHREVLRHSTADRASQGFAMVFFAPIIALYAKKSADERREDEADLQERLVDAQGDQERWSQIRGEPFPPPPLTMEQLPLHEAFVGMLDCQDMDQNTQRANADAATVAGRIWVAREKCVPAAAKWYLAAGQIDRARRLTFVANARARFQALACGDRDPGLALPERALVATAPTGWVNEYRAVVRDPATYDYELSQRGCHGTEDLPDRSSGMSKAMAVFALTAWTVPTPSTGPAG